MISPLAERALRVAEDELDLRTARATRQRVHHAADFLSGQAGTPGGR
jgi:hypothetical protein